MSNEIEPNDIKFGANIGKFDFLKDSKDNKAIDHDKDIPNYGKRSNLEISDVDINQSDIDLRVVENFKVPSNLKKTFICTMSLFILGITLIILGFIQDVAAADPGKGITFWTIGGIILIPGGYYSYQFYKARKCKSLEERNDILDEIPEI